MTRGIYLRANGEINCYCSTGEQIVLAKLPQNSFNSDFIREYYLKDKFKHIRDCMKDERLPFPIYCLKCDYFEPDEQFEPEKVETEIEWAHIEAAATCNLKCPFCVHGIPSEKRKYSREGPVLISQKFYNRLLKDIADAGLNIKWMYFSGRGEPGLHPDLWKMVKTAKGLFDTNFLVNTNGNIAYDDLIVDSGLDKIKIALESLDQATYSRYRIRGSVDRLLDLTKRIARRKEILGVKSPRIIWQKVMFNFNDSDEEFIEYQKRAIDSGVNELQFVFTWTKDSSVRRPEDFTKIFPDIEFIDWYQRFNFSIEALQSELQDVLQSKNIVSNTALISKIMRWFEFGAETRDYFDEFANLSFSDKKLYDLRKNSPYVDEYKSALKKCLFELSGLYKQKGCDKESSIYSGFSEAVNLTV